ARALLDGRQLDPARRPLDRLDVDPAEPRLRPCARVRRPLAESEPRALPHETPDANALLRRSAGRVQLRQAEQVAELVTENAEVAERRDLLLRDDAGFAQPGRGRYRRHHRVIRPRVVRVAALHVRLASGAG